MWLEIIRLLGMPFMDRQGTNLPYGFGRIFMYPASFFLTTKMITAHAAVIQTRFSSKAVRFQTRAGQNSSILSVESWIDM